MNPLVSCAATGAQSALDAAMEAIGASSDLYSQLETAARIIVEKFLPELPDL